MAIRIVTDSAADYKQEEILRRQIECLPMSVTFGSDSFLDGIELEKEEFYERLLEGKEFPKTSQPAPGAFLECFEAAKEANDSVIVILISGALSGTVQSAYIAKDMAEYDDVYIIDSTTATLGMRLLVDTAVVLREKGATVQQIVEEVERLKSKVHVLAGLDTLEYLAKGGRISKGAANIGNLANLKPLISIQEGKVDVCGKAIGMRRAYKGLMKIVDGYEIDEDYPVYFIYSYDRTNCAGFLHTMEKAGHIFDPVKIRGIGPTIGTHIGPGAFGMVFVEK
ncbi:MAG: DegV family protein [Eubacteriales bacterium]|nr:DegV family protein [Eubacteriales bacterium]